MEKVNCKCGNETMYLSYDEKINTYFNHCKKCGEKIEIFLNNSLKKVFAVSQSRYNTNDVYYNNEIMAKLHLEIHNKLTELFPTEYRPLNLCVIEISENIDKIVNNFKADDLKKYIQENRDNLKKDEKTLNDLEKLCDSM